jgi:hypothetical protein
VELWLRKNNEGALVAADDPSEKYVAKLKRGAMVRGDFKLPNNGGFHRKLMALYRLLFEHFEDRYDGSITHRGEAVKADFDRFREDLTIVAGHYEKTYSIDGELRLIAKSLSFGKMDEAERERVYSDLISAGLKRVLDRNWTEEKLRNAVDQIMEFDR